MSDSFALGKNAKHGSIDFSKIKSGIKKEDITNDNKSALKILFDFFDKNKDGVLSKEDIDNIQRQLKELDENGNNILNKDEIKSLRDSNGQKLDRSVRRKFFDFLKKIAKDSEEKGVKNVNDTANSEVITY